jgi:hypothetical protein
LPLILAKASGFENVILVVDNFDACDVQILPEVPFDSVHEYVFVHEFLKMALENTNFIAAAMDTDKFLQVMVPTQEDSVDLLAGIDLASTLDVNEVIGQDTGDKFAVHIDGDIFPLELNELMCGGVTHYLAEWKNLCDVMSRFESQQSGDEYDSLQLRAMSIAQDLVSLLYEREEKEFRVTSIVRIVSSEG